MQNKLILLVVLLIAILSGNTGLAQENFVPTIINYQGFLTDQNGTAQNGSYQITFALYSDSIGTISNVWEEMHEAVNVENGLFNILLGSIDTLTANDLAGERYLGIKLAGEPEMVPRMRLASVAYSLNAENAVHSNKTDSANYANNANTIDNNRIIFGTVGATGSGSGNGFTFNRDSEGIYTITFIPGFSSNPVVVVTGLDFSSAVDNFWAVGNVTDSTVAVESYDHTGDLHTLQDCPFNFIAIGSH